jgi:hypothetical protein
MMEVTVYIGIEHDEMKSLDYMQEMIQYPYTKLYNRYQ